MVFDLKIRKSAGVRVTWAVHRLIHIGNEARSTGRWKDAAAAYGRALRRAPKLAHIQIQYGHALKEGKRFEDADNAYAAAARLEPNASEPILYRARLALQRDRLRTGARHLITFLTNNPGDEAALVELGNLIQPIGALPVEQIQMLLGDPETFSLLSLDGASASGSNGPMNGGSGSARTTMFDITDLITHFGSQRLPNGIERVQIEVLVAALKMHGEDAISICCFVPARAGWIGIPAWKFLAVARLATSGADTTDPQWQAARAQLIVHLAFADRLRMPKHAILLNLGTCWWVHDYFLFVRNEEDRCGIRYVPAVYDFIPILAAEHCLRGVSENFINWTIGALRHADAFLTISRATRNDLLSVATMLGAPIDETVVEVVPLDADFRRTQTPLPISTLAVWDLENKPFALLVSTIESRKNHVLAFDAWAALVRRHGDAMPRLVCVGRNGWLNDHVYARLAADPLLKAAVTIVHSVSDAELALLYQKSCFTVYPSLYEGWGLPVTEALSYGRIPIVANNSSLPEAGGDFALMFESGSVAGLIAAVEKVTFDKEWRDLREAMIKSHFRPRSWQAVASQVMHAVARLPMGVATKPDLRAVRRGLYYPLGLPNVARIWPGLGSGEIFRAGYGWRWLEADGCRVQPQGGELRMRVLGEASDQLRLYVRLRGLAGDDCPFTILSNGASILQGVIAAGAYDWVACDLPVGTGMDLAIVIRGDVQENVQISAGGSSLLCIASLMVIGFAVCDRGDVEANARLVDLLRRDALSEINAYREPVGQ